MNKRQKKKRNKRIFSAVIENVRKRCNSVTITPETNLDKNCEVIAELIQDFYNTDNTSVVNVDVKPDYNKNVIEANVTLQMNAFEFDITIPNKDETV